MPTALPCDIGVVFALGTEQGCTEDLLADVQFIEAAGLPIRRGLLKDRSIVLVTSGPGPEAAVRACRILLDGHAPQWIISAGFCGGLQPQLRRNDIVAATGFADHPQLHPHIEAGFAKASAARIPAPAHRGSFATVTKIVSQSAEKRALGEQTGALVCEMESAAVAEICAEQGVPCLVLRVVSDPVEEDLPPDLEPLMAPQSTARTLGTVFGAIWRRPSSAKDLWRLKETAFVASDTLAKYLAGVMAALPLEPRLREPAALEDEQSNDRGDA